MSIELPFTNRRNVLYGLGATMGTVALNSLLHGGQRGEQKRPGGAGPHHVARAKNCIFLYMEGGPSHCPLV